jgi:hypothetical protein
VKSREVSRGIPSEYQNDRAGSDAIFENEVMAEFEVPIRLTVGISAVARKVG